MLTEVAVGREEGGQLVLVLTDEEGSTHVIPGEALAIHGELLGFTDVVDTIDAILSVIKRQPDDLDPATGENAFTSSFTVLEHREKARNEEVRCALADGKCGDPRSPKLRGAAAARKAVMEPVGATGDADSLVERVRGEGRGRLGVRRPRKKSCTGRLANPTCSAEPQTEDGASDVLNAEDRAQLAAALAEYVEEIGQGQAAFLVALSGDGTDPLDVTAPAELEDSTTDPTTLDGLVARHGGAA